MEKTLNGHEIWNLVDVMEKMYLTREVSIPQIAENLRLPESVVRKTLGVLNYNHTLKRSIETRLNGKYVYGVHTPEKFSFLQKYIDKEDN